MHDINITHKHELDAHDFLGCCKDCRASLRIIKPHIMAFAERIKKHDMKTIASLAPDDLYRTYQLLDDLAHMEAGERLAGLILDEPDIREILPVIHSYYAAFFTLHEKHLTEALLVSDTPWDILKSFPLYPRYKTLVRSQVQEVLPAHHTTMAFVGCGPMPITLILLNRLYGIRSIGLDNSKASANLAEKVIQCLGLENEIRIVYGDDKTLQDLAWDAVLVAALSEPKAKIFQTLRNILRQRGTRGPVIYRTYTGMQAVLYKPVQASDIKGFRIIKKIYPTGRVNNTTVIAELNE